MNLSVHRCRVGVGLARHRQQKRARALVRQSWRAATASSMSPDSQYDAWCIDRGIEAPALHIGYVAGGAPDEGETHRGCIVSAPIASGRVT